MYTIFTDPDVDLIIAVVGVVFTIFATIITIIIDKNNRRNITLVFFQKSRFLSIKKLFGGLDDLELSFKGEKLSECLMVFSGALINVGNVDIEKSLIHKPLELKLPEAFALQSFKISNTSKDVNVEFSFDRNKIFLSWDLLKVGEYISFDSVVELQSKNETPSDFPAELDMSRNLNSKIQFNQRITNLKKIKKINNLSPPISICIILPNFRTVK